ncbi:tRNA adenosine(34) deaminase TadA [Lujinxingia litoralis]|uniref:tRNA-specific adenosine deaminase n=1 Tax=Lujinxingia litoralis TaxID=2211119 RepID=A0A328C4L6_9DELT|nr:tRNA adenosine(34) deaminase TadA [Lujinxingia litoralis]
MSRKNIDNIFMMQALEEAEKAKAEGEVPVGAVVVYEGEIIARGFNRRETWQDPTAHAELIAVRRAAQVLGSWRLQECTVYVTLEPCPMCAGMLVNARVGRVVFGARDPKAGAMRSLFAMGEDPRLNHSIEVKEGVLSAASGRVLSEFFRSIREKRKASASQDDSSNEDAS